MSSPARRQRLHAKRCYECSCQHEHGKGGSPRVRDYALRPQARDVPPVNQLG